MKTETKFDLGQRVVPISKKQKKEFIPCDTCGGTGKIIVQSTQKKFTCPDCYGRRGDTVWKDEEWAVCYDYISNVGKIDIELYSGNRINDSKIAYMIEATGVGSGSMWDEEKLFATEEEAIAECLKRNHENFELQ